MSYHSRPDLNPPHFYKQEPVLMLIEHNVQFYDTADALWNSLNATWREQVCVSLFGSTVVGEPGRYYRIWRGKIYRSSLS